MCENCQCNCQNKTSMQMVEEFHRAFGHPVNEKWLIKNPKFIDLRFDLIQEEVEEICYELYEFYDPAYTVSSRIYGKITPNLIKEIADLQYVLDGLCVALGIDKDEAVRRVHESNMSKLGEDGKPILREDGKVLKGPNYKEPDMTDLVP